MNKQFIAIKKLGGALVEVDDNIEINNILHVTSLCFGLIRRGYLLSGDLVEELSKLSVSDIDTFMFELNDTVNELTGYGTMTEPLFAGFNNVSSDDDADDNDGNDDDNDDTTEKSGFGAVYAEIINYAVTFSHDCETLGLVTESEFYNVFTQLVSTPAVLSEEDTHIVKWFMASGHELIYPATIPMKETSCLVAAVDVMTGNDITSFVGNATDILRIATELSGGDVSLSTNTKFKSLPRKIRRVLVTQLERVINEEDIRRHSNKWNKLFHNLHVGDFSKVVYDIAEKQRNNKRLASFHSDVDILLNATPIDVDAVVKLLTSRPSEYARAFSRVLGLTGDAPAVVVGFTRIVDNIPTRILLQVLGSMKTRHIPVTKRTVFPKGLSQRGVVLTKPLSAINTALLDNVIDAINHALRDRFKTSDTMGRVWLDPQLKKCPVPTAQRSASRALKTLERGTRVPMGDGDVIRMFLYWVGIDIDLSATLYSADYTELDTIYYGNTRGSTCDAHHSGDITDAPDGASEYIDINIVDAVNNKVRYVQMIVDVYSGETFAEHEICFTGWMQRDAVDSNAIYTPTSVVNKIDLTAETKNGIPVIFDLVTREVIWCDTVHNKVNGPVNNAVVNKATNKDMMMAMLNMCYNRVSLYELFKLHIEANGELCEDRSNANIEIGFNTATDCADITPYDINTILREFMT